MKLMAEQGEDGGEAGGGNLPSGGDAIGTGNDARIALLNSIGDQADTLRADDLADINDDGSTTPFVAPIPEGSDPEAATEAPPQQMITRKVNGKEVTLPLEEWLVRAQKVESADEYLIDAARQRKEARPEQPPAPAEPQGPSKEEIAAQQLAERRQLARAIQMGTEEEAVAALEKLQNMVRTPSLTVADVGRVADERLRFNAALTWFGNEYKDILANPQLYQMVVDKEATLIRNGDTRPYAERYKEVGDSVRTWRDELISSSAVAATPATGTPVTSLETKRAAKAAAPKAPTAASTKATPVVEAEEDESPSAVIAAMAKSRGGPQWARG